MPHQEEPCECELNGPYYTGVPGILAAMETGRIAQEAVVERCDLCRRYPSDAVAWAKLRELGRTEPMSAAEGQPSSFTVQCYAVVLVEFPGVVANDAKVAARRVLDRFDWDVHGRDAQFTDSDLVVLIDDGTDLGRPRRFALECAEVEG